MQPSDLHRSSNWNHHVAYVGTHKPPILSIAALDTKTHTLCSRSSRLIVGLNGQLKSLYVCVCANQPKRCISFQQRIKRQLHYSRKRAPYLATPSKYIQDFSQEITLSIEFSTTTSSSIYYKTTVAKLHENTKIWSRPTLVQQSAIEIEDAIERKRKRETEIVQEEAHK